ncbi:MAG: hypothetical protein FWH08_02450 [Oscillospiraceae bacterium]|nr:hypothetical protein [Oscillospiraceae bacterium]
MKKLTTCLLLFAIALSVFTLPASASSAKTVDEAVAEIMKTVPKNATDLEKITIFYDWMNDNVIYTRSKSSIHSALVEKQGNCDGFARSVQRLLTEAEIENMYIVGTASGTFGREGHAWNLVKLDGKWYHMDTLFKDMNKYNNFLISDDALARKTHEWNRERYPATAKNSYATNTRSSGEFVPAGDSVYYFDRDKKQIKRYNATTKKTTTFESNITDPCLGKYGDYIEYKTANGYVFYNYRTNTKTPHSIEGNLITVQGDTAFFSNTEDGSASLTVFDIKSKTTRTPTPPKSAGGNLEYIGIHNGKVYFNDWYDIYAYDTASDKFTKLKRPADIIVADSGDQYFRSVEIIEKNGKTYLKWEIRIPITDEQLRAGVATSVSKTREIK